MHNSDRVYPFCPLMTGIFDSRTSNDSAYELVTGECHYHIVNEDYHKQAPDELDVSEGEIARIIDDTHGGMEKSDHRQF